MIVNCYYFIQESVAKPVLGPLTRHSAKPYKTTTDRGLW